MGVSLIRGVHADCQRLDQRRFLSGHVVRNLEAETCFMGDILLEYAVYRRGREEDDVRAEIISSTLAELTFSAGLSRLHGHAVTDLQILDILSDFDNRTPGFMSQNERIFNDKIADSSGLIIMQIRTAHAYIFHLHQDFIILGLRDRALLDLAVFQPGHNCRLHGSLHNLTSSLSL